MSERERELVSVDLHYKELIKLAEQYGVDNVALYGQWAIAKAVVVDKQAAEEKKKVKDLEAEKREVMIGSAEDIASAIFQISANNRQAENENTFRVLELARAKELENKNLTEQQKKAINEKYDAKIKAEKVKAFKADQQASIAQALMAGALGALQLWVKPGFPAAIPLAIGLGVQTAANVGIIAAQKPPAYQFGGFSDMDSAGYVDKETYFSRSATGRPFVAGEAGREWIAPNWMLQNPRTANIIGMLEAARQDKRMFASGGFSDNSTTAPVIELPAANFDTSRLEAKMDLFIDAANNA